MVDSRQKGSKAETDVKIVLKKHTSLGWERIPLSGALDAKHGLKGDLYVPGVNTKYCVEVKHYKDDHLTSKLLTSKDPQFIIWWEQTIREAQQINKKPLLIYKFDRSKLFVAFDEMPTQIYDYITINVNDYVIYTTELNEWLTKENPKFV